MTAAANPLPVARPRRRWLRRVAAFLAAIAAIVSLALGYQYLREHREWRAACAEADEADPGWRWEDLRAARPAVPVERDRARGVAAAIQLLPDANRFEKLATRLRAQYAALAPQRRPAPEVAAALRELHNAATAVRAELLRLSQVSDGVPMPGDLFEPGSGTRHFDFVAVTRDVLIPELWMQAEAGDADAALATARTVLDLARPVGDNLVLLDVLVANAVRSLAAAGVERVLAQGEPGPAALDAACRRFAAEAERPLFLNALRGERAALELAVRAYDEGRLTASQVDGLFDRPPDRTGSPPLDRWLHRLAGGGFRRGHATARLRHSTWMIERLQESPDALAAHTTEWNERRRRLPRQAASHAEVMARYLRDGDDERALIRAAAVALAAERFRRECGHWPAASAELVPQYLPSTPVDPHDLKPLRLTRLPDGLVIYSVGSDLTDDDGRVGVRGTPRGGSDVGVRLWDVPHRRQPPAPPAAGP